MSDGIDIGIEIADRDLSVSSVSSVLKKTGRLIAAIRAAIDLRVQAGFRLGCSSPLAVKAQ